LYSAALAGGAFSIEDYLLLIEEKYAHKDAAPMRLTGRFGLVRRSRAACCFEAFLLLPDSLKIYLRPVFAAAGFALAERYANAGRVGAVPAVLTLLLVLLIVFLLIA
jgi:hypothetical protein